MRFAFWSSIVALLAMLAMPFLSYAAKLSPDSSDLVVTSGQMAVATIEIENTDAVAETFDVDFMRAMFGTEADSLSFTGFLGDQRSWLTAKPAHFVLDAGAKQSVDIDVLVPFGTMPQALTVAVLAKSVGGGEGIVVTPALASMLFLHIGEGLQGNVSINSFEVLPKWVWSGQATIAALFKNDGTDTVVAPSVIRVKNFLGQSVSEFMLSSEPKRIPPGTYRSVSAVWPSGGFHPFLFGSYSFELVDHDRVLAKNETTFLSWPIFLVLGGVILFVILGILKFVRRHRQTT